MGAVNNFMGMLSKMGCAYGKGKHRAHRSRNHGFGIEFWLCCCKMKLGGLPVGT